MIICIYMSAKARKKHLQNASAFFNEICRCATREMAAPWNAPAVREISASRMLKGNFYFTLSDSEIFHKHSVTNLLRVCLRRTYLYGSALPRRNGLCSIPIFLYRKISHTHRHSSFVAKRHARLACSPASAHNGSLPLPPFCELRLRRKYPDRVVSVFQLEGTRTLRG